ncbi:MAG TPA: ATPase [Deltaproteobacteria bacterium]|nr:MAG: hypothetical protein A2Z79_09025 [Deltaproteobacteria bacterium GWA2_55_82]OGQ64658.1 MAG: hypothetical protein A3I81_11290 [Deltaproteobacteria bacterium RIFCSPLOWO2_02_FULL_55_12]OIJ75060.1 MAG: hypothetical protein A2V21_305160 [Deltaproteobacteria bacterium GWC2_55_46]HBG45900.1 ATPase [Deltaproteobacteria bacterium]HCY09681.1 ATPase [Deltaproteobacteria bacterium]
MSDYEKFFGLSAKPFELVPNPEFLYMSKTHRKATMYLEYGINERAGFILLSGEVGAGKTTLIRNLINGLGKDVVVSKVFSTRVDSEQLLRLINTDFGLKASGNDKTVLMKELYDFLIEMYAKRCSPVLIIDEAQNLSMDLLEEVRMLSNLETDSSKLLQIILVGQPELKAMLARPELRQLRQRINISCHLYNLLRNETEEYIFHRLQVAGNRNAVSFTTEALDIIHRYSNGIPRLINIICDFLMLTAYMEKARAIDARTAIDIVRELDFENQYWASEKAGDKDGGCRVEAAPKAQPEQVISMINEVSERVDLIEKRPAGIDVFSARELGRRLDLVERLVSEHFEKNHSVPEKEDERPEPYDTVIKYTNKISAEEKPLKKGIFRRILG